MKKHGLPLAAVLIAALPLLQGCVPAVIATGTAAGVMTVQDRRQAGVQAQDETIEWKALQSVPPQYAATAHLNFTSFNKHLLITGEVAGDEAKSAIGNEAGKIAGVKTVYNETTIGPASSLTGRSNDSYITSKVKARLVDEKYLSANHIKVVTEAGTTFLMGIVSEREAKLAVIIARTTDGVRKVVNLLEVVSDGEIRRLDTQPATVETRQ